MVLDLARPVTERRLVHRRRAIAGAHRSIHRSIQRHSPAIRLEKEKGLPAPVQESPYHSTLIPGTSSRLSLWLTLMALVVRDSRRVCAIAFASRKSRIGFVLCMSEPSV